MESKRPGSGFFQNDVYKDLLHAMRIDDENKFNQILTSENVNVNKVYEKGSDYGTLLDFCSVEGNKSKYIATLLNRGANPNLINSRTKKGPIHQVALQEDSESMRVLLEHRETDPNLLDNFGSTALHYACKNNDVEMVQTILQRPETNLNITNRKGKAPLHIVLDKEPSAEYVDVLHALLSKPDLDLTLTDYDGVTLQQMIEESYPDLVNELSVAGNDVRPNLDVSFLFQLLRRNNYRQFLNHVKGNRDILEGNDGSYTLLQYCCEYGIDDVAQALLDEGVDPNATCSTNIWPPIMIACRKGYVSIVKMLVNSKKTSYQPVNIETVLHCIVNGGYGKQGLSESNTEKNYQKCLSYLLQKVPKGRIDVNYRDKNGNTALHYAAKVGDQNIVLEMLNAGAYIGVCNKLNEPACADITQSTMERHLDSCIVTNDKLPRDEMFALIFNYSCLIPFNKSEDRVISNSSEHFIKVSINDNDGKHLHKSGETDPLIHMSKNHELRPLLTHPIFTSYLHLKWHKIKPYYFINLLGYFLFWFILTYYILGVYVSSPSDDPSLNTTSVEPKISNKHPTDYLAWALVLIFLLLIIVREMLQLIISPLKYVINPENWLEICIIVITILILFYDDSSIKHQISAIGILASWAEFVLLIGKHPSLSTNIEMFKTVSWNFLKFLAWYSILIVAFALCFYTLFKDATDEDNQFQYFGVSIFKTVVMLTGEFDSASIPFVLFPGLSRVLFVLFVFLIAIVLFNLLNGLAVSDTQAIKADAELVGYISQAKLISHVEEKVSNGFNCWGLLSTTYKFSNAINMFHEISEGKIRVYPNNANRVELDDMGLVKNRKHEETENCYEFKSIYMDPRIVKAAREILFKREHEKSHENYLVLVTEKENELRELLEEFKECLREYKDINLRMNQQFRA
uniref:Ion transport domain-containing protein n=1 Tax=Lygus hesperus TaxID=30085 RepID=A0A0K8SLJ5_LYGHE